MELSSFSAGGLTQSNTMKLQGLVQGRNVLVLIDSRASHNLISSKLMEDLRLLVEETPVYRGCL